MRVGKFALIVPVITSTDGRWVAMIRCIPAARAICASRWIAASISLPATSIKSAISSTTTTIRGSSLVSNGCGSKSAGQFPDRTLFAPSGSGSRPWPRLRPSGR